MCSGVQMMCISSWSLGTFGGQAIVYGSMGNWRANIYMTCSRIKIVLYDN